MKRVVVTGLGAVSPHGIGVKAYWSGLAAGACSGKAYNIAGGASWTLLDILGILGRILEVEPVPEFTDPRPGDVHRSQADASAAARDLAFTCTVPMEDGLARTVSWLRAGK